MSDIVWQPVTVPLSALVPWDRNPKTISKAHANRLLDLWQRLGQFQTIAIGPAGEVYDGHQRLSVLKAAHGPRFEVTALQADRALTEKEREELTVAAHVGTTGQFSWEELSGWDTSELQTWGFDAELLQDWNAGAAALATMLDSAQDAPPDDPGPQIDRAEELREKWQTAPGQMWQLGEHRLICGDCTDAGVVARVMGGEKAGLVVTSPPYAVGKEYESGVSFAEHIKLLENMADRCMEVVTPGGFIFTNFGEIAAQSHAGPLTGSDRQCVYLISKDYWRIFHEERKCDLYAQRIWYKPFNRLQQPFWSYKTSIPHYQEWEHIWTWRTPGGNGDRRTDWDVSVHAVWDTRNESTDDKPLTRHVAAFPVGIPERAIKAHSLAGELVMEPFSGSGTTLIACERLGRRCRGVEISPAYVAVTLQRWADMTGGEPVLVTDEHPRAS